MVTFDHMKKKKQFCFFVVLENNFFCHKGLKNIIIRFIGCYELCLSGSGPTFI